ncbi:MAG: hypothetical protein GEV06_16835 [Luteitalea sp.]|nr:hypothetical protein [Luteitalea sp.]
MKPFIREATLADVHAVMADLSGVSASEVLRGKTWWQALPLTRELCKQGPVDALIWGGEPIAVLGHIPANRDPYTRFTWTRYRQAFFEHGLRTMLIARKYMKTLQLLYPGVKFDSYTNSRHPDIVRWHKLFGYEFMGEYNGQALLFRLKPLEAPAPVVEKRDTGLPTPA